jgi:hypothetical protein
VTCRSYHRLREVRKPRVKLPDGALRLVEPLFAPGPPSGALHAGPTGSFGATKSRLRMSLKGRRRVYVNAISLPQTCRST